MLGVFKPLWRETARGGGHSRLSTQDLRKNLVAASGAQYGGPHD